MRPNIARTVCFTALSVCLAAVVSAGARKCTCSYASVKGAWGYSESGTLYHPVLGAVPYASVGSYTVDQDGNLSGARTASVGGAIQPVAIQGTATVNPDCTGTMTLRFYDASDILLNTAVKFVVYVDDSTAARSIITDIVLPDNVTHLKAVLVTDAKKLFANTEVVPQH